MRRICCRRRYCLFSPQCRIHRQCAHTPEPAISQPELSAPGGSEMPAMSLSMRATPTISANPWGALGSSHGLVGLAALMEATAGSPEVSVAVIDGPVDRSHAA